MTSYQVCLKKFEKIIKHPDNNSEHLKILYEWTNKIGIFENVYFGDLSNSDKLKFQMIESYLESVNG